MIKTIRSLLSLFLVAASMALSAEHPVNTVNPVTPDLPRLEDPLASASDALSVIDLLIKATQQSLEKQIALRSLIVEYQGIRKISLEKPNDNAQLARMIKAGHRLLESIKENHLMDAFDPEFLGELNLLSQLATKRKG